MSVSSAAMIPAAIEPARPADSPRPTDTEWKIITTRVVNAPRNLVWKAWSDPDRLARWWGPKGFTNTFYCCDMRSGGLWHFVMHSPGGLDFMNQSTFVEVVKPELIVIHHLSGPQFQLTVNFTEHAGRTRITWRMSFASAEEYERVKTFAPTANEQNLDRLEAQLELMV
jgi:uncharacterized protein YndB with AHSA1/START domain